MSTVWMYHPRLDRKIEQPASAAGQLAMSGWVECDSPPKTESEPDAGAEETSTQAPKRRPRSKRSET